jgi:hypothetical protein
MGIGMSTMVEVVLCVLFKCLTKKGPKT